MRAAICSCIALASAVAAGGAEPGGIVWENARLRAVLGADAKWQSLTDKAAGRDVLAASADATFATAHVAGKARRACRAVRDGKRLTVAFAGCDTKLTYTVAAERDWIAFRLVGVSGARPERLTLLRLPASPTRRVGPILNCAWDARSAVCLRSLNLQTHGRAARRGKFAELSATTQDAPGPKLEGAAAALIVAPPAELRGILRSLAETHKLPRSADPATHAPAKGLPLARQSYWFLAFGEKDTDRVIDLCRRTGFRQVMMLSHSWCRTVGHYTFRKDTYPQGVESLRRTVAKLHAAGILVGMHCYASKISKTDAYVTPVPDRRFWVDRTASLAGAVGAKDAQIRTASDLRDWPGSPVARQKTWEGGVKKHQEVLIDDEIVRYDAIGPAGGWDTFLGCKRGAWGTRAAAHDKAAACRHYGVDGCINGYIIDQETDLLDEATSRLAAVFNACGFDMVYFDGGEDVDRRRFTYYASKFQAAAMAKFRKRPIVHMGTILTHALWHSFARSGTVDTYLNTLYGRIISGAKVEAWPTVREHIDRSVRRLGVLADDMMPGELGWFGIWAKGKHTDGLQLDEIEYLVCKSLAYDAPISLQSSFGQMARHPLTEGILEIVGAYERLRLGGIVHAATRERLRPTGKDFILLRRDGKVHFVAAAPVKAVAGSRDVRSLVGAFQTGSVATLWHYTGRKGRLLLPAGAPPVAAVDVAGKPIALAKAAGGTAVPVTGRRTTLVFGNTAPEAARELLAAAKLELAKPGN